MTWCPNGGEYKVLESEDEALFKTIYNNETDSPTVLSLMDGTNPLELPVSETSTLGLFLNDSQSQLMELMFEVINVTKLTYTVTLANGTEIDISVSFSFFSTSILIQPYTFMKLTFSA